MLLKKVSVLYLFFFFIFLLPNARANTQNQLSFEQKLSDLDQLVAQIRANYGPLQYKQSRFNFLLDDLRAKYVEKIQQTKNNGEFHFFLSFYFIINAEFVIFP